MPRLFDAEGNPSVRPWVWAGFVAALALLAVPPRASAQRNLDASAATAAEPGSRRTMVREPSGKVTVRATPLSAPVTFDGAVDEAMYRLTEPYTDFVQQEPHEGAPATERTEAWIFFDDKYIYVAAKLYESHPEHRVANDMRRDAPNLYNNDHLAVMFDTFNDHRNAYGFTTNRLGALFDFYATNEQPSGTWNGLWEARARDFDGGWSIEMRIPFRSIRVKDQSQVWGVNFRRMVRWKNETSFLSAVPRSWGRRALTKVSNAATLLDIVPPKNGLNLDVKPYTLGSLLTNRSASPSVANKRDGNAGMDVKWGITSQVIADLTYRTDFAQVEDDDSQVNLTRFSLFVPEKREFFLEGQDAFAFGGTGGGGSGGGSSGGFNATGVGNTTDLSPILFYSRRIGLTGNMIAPIVGGARVLGRAGGWQVGALSMRTEEAPTASAPPTTFSVLRLNREIGRRSRIGLLATSRDPMADTSNVVGGVDAQINLRDDIAITGFAARSKTAGQPGDESSYRGKFDLNADRYGLLLEHLFVGNGFDPGVGFLRRSAFRRSLALARLSPRPAHIASVRRFTYQASADYITDSIGRAQSEEFKGAFITELSNGDVFNAEVSQAFERLDRPFAVARGVTVPVGSYRYNVARATYTLGTQRPVSGALVLARGSFYDGTLSEMTWRGRVDVSPRLVAEPTVSYNRISGPFGQGESNLIGSRLTYTMSPRMFAAALVQYQSRTQSMTTNVRLRWEYSPGSELFIVYSDGRLTDGPGFPALDNRSIIVKATRLFRW
ncbi:MAG: carbohydrate binding family 9 domain-containing protein [Gemmatimonadaceae bacterium]|nr:carbohydrate binding family 9 domain-containing protein [Gemmatimonadaceae bacterium]